MSIFLFLTHTISVACACLRFLGSHTKPVDNYQQQTEVFFLLPFKSDLFSMLIVVVYLSSCHSKPVESQRGPKQHFGYH